MRILHISKYYHPYIGGVENFCKYLVEGAERHETICFNEACKDTVDVVNGHQRVVDHFTIPKMIEKQEECYVKLMEVYMIQIVIGGVKSSLFIPFSYSHIHAVHNKVELKNAA